MEFFEQKNPWGAIQVKKAEGIWAVQMSLRDMDGAIVEPELLRSFGGFFGTKTQFIGVGFNDFSLRIVTPKSLGV